MTLYFNLPSISPTTGGGGGASVNVTPLDITPSTSAQSFAPATGNAYAPVNVSAVTSAIDPNITASNIVNGVNILGVIGSASATAPKEVARYKIDENGVVDISDKDVTGMFESINSVANRAMEYAFYDTQITGNVCFLNCTSVGYNSLAFAFANTNITALCFPNTTLTSDYSFYAGARTCNNISVVDFHNLQTAGTASFSYAFFNSTVNTINFNRLNSADNYAFEAAFRESKGLKTAYFANLKYAGANAFNSSFSFSKLESFDAPVLNTIGGFAFLQAFQNATNFKYFNIGGNVNSVVAGDNAFNSAFRNTALVSFLVPIAGATSSQFANAFFNCQNLTTVNLYSPNIYANSGAYNVYLNMCNNCPNLVSVDLSSLRNVGYSVSDNSFDNAFKNCYNLTSVNLYSFEPLQAGAVFRNAYWNCINLKTMEYPALYCLGTGNCFDNAYRNSGIQNLYFSGLYNYTNNGNTRRPFVNMLTNVSDCTVHFPAMARTYLENHQDFIAGFGGTNTTILFDLPNVVNNFTNFYSMSSSGEMGGMTLAVDASSESADAWQAMNSTAGTGWHSAVSEVEHYYTIYCPEGMRLTYANLITDSTVNQITNQPVMTNVCVSNDGTNWNQVRTTMITVYESYKNITFSKPGYHKYYRFYFNSYQNNPSYLTTINRIYLYGSHKYI